MVWRRRLGVEVEVDAAVDAADGVEGWGDG